MAEPSLFLLLHLSSLFLLRLSSAATFPGDLAALRELHSALSSSPSLPPSSCLLSWDLADPCGAPACGLRCSAPSPALNLSRVTHLALDPAPYSAPLPPSLFSLSSPRPLSLPDNPLSGPLPRPLPPLPSPRRLSPSRNLLSGPLPPLSSPFPSLRHLSLDGNLFSGPLPSPPLLRRLDLHSNLLESLDFDAFPPHFRPHFLAASDNRLSGELPRSPPPSLLLLSLRNNRLSGPLPGNLLESLPRLQVLDLGGNAITGEVPAALWTHPSLEQVNLRGNRLERLADAGWGSRLVAVDLGGNRISGGLPGGLLAGAPRLSALDLAGNRFTGGIPAEYVVRVVAGLIGGGGGAVAPLRRLALGGNYLCGGVPAALMAIKEGDAEIDLGGNCLVSCPDVFFFCRGAAQRSSDVCDLFNP
ncbi:uncharacterized protein LOC144715204 [Wolffia australiana]